MGFQGKIFNGWRRSAWSALVAASCVSGFLPPCHAQNSARDVIDSILERQPAGTNDLNQDAKVNVLDLVLFLNQRPIVAWFPTKATTVNSWDGSAEVEIAFSEPVTGSLTYQLGGSAISGDDYIQPAPTITLSGATSAKLPIQLKPQSALRTSRQLVITLQVRKDGNVRTGGGENNRYSTHNIRIRDADAGLYSGTMGFYSKATSTTSGGQTTITSEPAPPIAPCSFRMGLRSASSAAGAIAIISMPQTGFLPEQFEMPATLAGDSKTFTAIQSATGTRVLTALGGRSVVWKFEFLPKSADNPWFGVGGAFDSDCLLTVQGLSGTGKPLVIRGRITSGYLE
jgi:hypothetical protein